MRLVTHRVGSSGGREEWGCFSECAMLVSLHLGNMLVSHMGPPKNSKGQGQRQELRVNDTPPCIMNEKFTVTQQGEHSE